jgi:hypothetical protein
LASVQQLPTLDRPAAEPHLAPAEAPAAKASLAATLRESKEIVFILVGIAVAFTVHFGFGDFVQTESSTPKARSVPAAKAIGEPERVRAAAFQERYSAERRRRFAQDRAARRAARAAAAAAAAAARRAPAASARRSAPASTVRRTSPKPTPSYTPSPSPRPKPAPARSGGGGGGGQSFDDSG